MTKDNMDTWGNYTGSNFLKSTDVAGESDAFVTLNIEEFHDAEGSGKPRLTLGKGDKEFNFDLNVTNSKICANSVSSPRKLIGKKIFFKKVMVMSPKTKTEVESLRILRIE